MKEYSSIPRSIGQDFREFDAWVFDKKDGIHTRWMWHVKKGWCRFGTRHRLFDETDPIFGSSIPLFLNTLADPLAKLARKNRWLWLIAFAEYYGTNSLGGRFVDGEERFLSLFDIAPHSQGILEPRQFVKLIVEPGLPSVAFLGKYKWTRGFVDRVRNFDVPGITREGVVGKQDEYVMAKAKTQKWIDMIIAMHGEEEGRKIIES